MSTTEALAERLGKIQKSATVAGVLALAASVVGALFSPDQFFRSYLIGYLLWLGVALGSLAVLMIQHLVTGNWGLVSRRILESSTRTLFLLAVLFLPLLLGLDRIYIWASPEHVTGDAILEHKASYLNVAFFVIRAVAYFAIWLGLAFQLNRWSRQQDQGERDFLDRFQLASGIGLLLYGITASFAAVDWLMSLEPHWFSTIYGLQFIAGQVLSGLAFTVPVLLLLSSYQPLSERIRPSHFHDYGNLLLAFVLLWAYLAFSQYLIIWSGNLPEEIPWYLNRTEGGWQWVGLVLVVFHFAVPFLLLLSRAAKRSGRVLAQVAVAILVLRLVDLIWLVEPAFSSEGIHIHWMDIAAPVGIGGVWLSVFLWQLKSLPLLPQNDPRFAESLSTREALEHGTR